MSIAAARRLLPNIGDLVDVLPWGAVWIVQRLVPVVDTKAPETENLSSQQKR